MSRPNNSPWRDSAGNAGNMYSNAGFEPRPCTVELTNMSFEALLNCLPSSEVVVKIEEEDEEEVELDGLEEDHGTDAVSKSHDPLTSQSQAMNVMNGQIPRNFSLPGEINSNLDQVDVKPEGFMWSWFHCHHCNFSTPYKNRLRIHAAKHLPPSFFCKLCPYKAVANFHLQSHMRTHSEDKPYRCEMCDYKTKWPSGLKHHVRLIHENTRPYSCPFCPYRSKTNGTLKIHVKTHTGIKDFKCPHKNCPFVAYTSNAVKTHMKVHSGEKPHSCPHCDYRGVRPMCIKMHIKHVHERIKHLKCPHCEYRSSISQNMIVHVRTHSDYRAFECTFCEFRVKSKSALKNHLLTHSNIRPYGCFHCGYRAKRLLQLKYHIKEVHLKLKPFKCDVCHYRGSRRKNLVSHKARKHGGPDRPKLHACSECEYRSADKSSLKKHMLVHSDVKPFKCSKCPFRTKTLHSLDIHGKEIHLIGDPKKFHCKFCKFHTFRKVNLRDHLLIHSGEFPFSCDLCPYKARKKRSLKLHMSVKHRHSC